MLFVILLDKMKYGEGSWDMMYHAEYLRCGKCGTIHTTVRKLSPRPVGTSHTSRGFPIPV